VPANIVRIKRRKMILDVIVSFFSATISSSLFLSRFFIGA
jgi:hypothetical protein